MGNCQAAEAATVVIVHPGNNNNNNKVERIYWSVRAHDIMNANPGHYVAAVVAANSPAAPARQLRLLRPDDTLHIGHVYRLISFEDVLEKFASKEEEEGFKLGKLMEKRQGDGKKKLRRGSCRHGAAGSVRVPDDRIRDGEEEMEEMISRPRMVSDGCRGLGSYSRGGGGHWRPALQSIAEF